MSDPQGREGTATPDRRGRGERRVEDRKVDTDRRQKVVDRRSDGNESYVTFWVGENRLGVRADQVREVLEARPIARVPLAPPAVPGLLNLRGQIVCALDLRILFGLTSTGTPGMNVVVRDRAEVVGLLVDRVGDVIEVSRSAIRPPPATLGHPWRDACLGVVKHGDSGLLMVMDIPRIVDGADRDRGHELG